MEKNFIKHIDKVTKWLIYKNISGISCEFTKDKSIWYTFITDNYNFYLEIFLDENMNEEETILNIFQKDRKSEPLGYCGTLEKCLEQIDLKFN